jgi:hypothetical protein
MVIGMMAKIGEGKVIELGKVSRRLEEEANGGESNVQQ